MTAAPAARTRVWLLLAVALTLVGAALGLSGTAVAAAEPVGPETVAARVDVSAGQRLETGQVSYDVASGSRVATRGATGAADDVATSGSRWSKTEFSGNRVYQRDDLIDVARTDARGRTSLELMQGGYAPIGPDGKPMPLHHMIQRQDGPLAEVTQTFHQANSRVIHINPRTIPSGIERTAFNAWKRDYWHSRACDFGGC